MSETRETEAGVITSEFNQNEQRLKQILHPEENFDIIIRRIQIGGRAAALYYMDGMVKDELLEKVVESFFKLQETDMPKEAEAFTQELLPYTENELCQEIDKLLKNLLSGVTVLLIDGYSQAILMDLRTYPARSVEEPEKDRVMRGSRDGFVETLIMNTALLRRRIRSTDLRIRAVEIGASSRTDIAVCYMESRVDKVFLQKVMNRLMSIEIDALTMNQESLGECIHRGSWLNPFPKFKYSERPDTAAASVLEGNIAIFVDNSPAAMILPATFFDIIEEADDYYFPPVTGTYLRLSRFLGNLLALLLTPTWLLFLANPGLVPDWLAFVLDVEQANIPILWQLLILELAIDGLRLASINTPNMLSTPLSVIAGIVMGDFATSSGWFAPQSMLYMAFVSIATYTQASFELGYALKFMRLILLVLTAFFGIWGYVAGLLLAVFCIVCNRTLSGKSYLAPLLPFNGSQLLQRFFRVSLPRSEKKP